LPASSEPNLSPKPPGGDVLPAGINHLGACGCGDRGAAAILPPCTTTLPFAMRPWVAVSKVAFLITRSRGGVCAFAAAADRMTIRQLKTRWNIATPHTDIDKASDSRRSLARASIGGRHNVSHPRGHFSKWEGQGFNCALTLNLPIMG
jgi:hypothetical protein